MNEPDSLEDQAMQNIPKANPADPKVRLLRALFGFCPDCDDTSNHTHEEVPDPPEYEPPEDPDEYYYSQEEYYYEYYDEKQEARLEYDLDAHLDALYEKAEAEDAIPWNDADES